MNGYDRTWPTAVAAIGVGAFIGWAVLLGPRMTAVDASMQFDAAKLAPAAETPVAKTMPARPTTDRARQISVLAGMGPDELAELLRWGENAVDRRNAAVLLGAHPANAAALMIAMRTDPSPEVRFKSAESLGRIGLRPTMGSLHLAATLDADLRVREAAVGALADVGQAESIPILADILSSDPSEHVRAQAVRSLFAIGDREALAVLSPILREERSEIVARAAQEALTTPRSLAGGR